MREYFAAVYNRVMVEFKPKTDKRGREVTLTLDRRASYNTVARELAKVLEADASKIRFTTANTVTKQPKDVISYASRLSLEAMTPSMLNALDYAHSVGLESIPPPILYYEVLDVNLADLETKKSLKISILHPTLRDETSVNVLVPRTGSGRELFEALCAKGKLENKSAEKIRVYEVVGGRITCELSMDQPIDDLGDKAGSALYAEVKDLLPGVVLAAQMVPHTN